MKIYTRVEYRWDAPQERYVVAFAESFDYVGPLARCDEGGGDPTGGGSSGGDPKGDTPGVDTTPQDIPSGGDVPSDVPGGDVPGGDTSGGDTGGSKSGIPDIVKDVGGAAAKTLAQTGIMAGAQALTNRKANNQADAFNKQIAGLIANSNNQSYNTAQAVPLTPAAPAGLSGSGGRPSSPAATVASMNQPAPVSSTPTTAAGTQPAPNSPPGGGQTGAIKLGVRPESYA